MLTQTGGVQLPADLLRQDLMLASPGKDPAELVQRLHDGGRHLFDVKWDGVRAMAFIDHGQVLLRNRRGADITSRYPDVVANLLATYPGTNSKVLDGEIIVWNGERFEFTLALKRDSQSLTPKINALARKYPATFMAFDLLWSQGHDLRQLRLQERLELLHGDAGVLMPGVLHSTHGLDGVAMWQACEQFGFEGLIAKERTSQYTGRRHMSWIKLKRLQRVTCIVTGYDPGEGGRRDQVGALHLALLDEDGDLVPVGRVGTGFKQSDHGPLLQVLNAARTDPNAHTEFLVEVEFMEFQKSALRMPSYKGVRFDVTRADCTLSQVQGLS